MTDNQPEPEGLSRAGAIVLCVIGAFLLLPGLCSVSFTHELVTGMYGRDLLGAWITGIVLGAAGVVLITLAILARRGSRGR
jgi:hypothetical protein